MSGGKSPNHLLPTAEALTQQQLSQGMRERPKKVV